MRQTELASSLVNFWVHNNIGLVGQFYLNDIFTDWLSTLVSTGCVLAFLPKENSISTTKNWFWLYFCWKQLHHSVSNSVWTDTRARPFVHLLVCWRSSLLGLFIYSKIALSIRHVAGTMGHRGHRAQFFGSAKHLLPTLSITSFSTHNK